MTDNKHNTGRENSGSRNSGDHNSGHYNSGNCNSGDYNSGHCNSGDYNSGSYNSGYYNSGSYNSGWFNTKESTLFLFDKDSGKFRKDLQLPYIFLPLTEWVDDKLIKRTYKEAWTVAWGRADSAKRKQFTDLPGFDSRIFFEITGIDVERPSSCHGKIVMIDGKEYKLQEVGRSEATTTNLGR